MAPKAELVMGMPLQNYNTEQYKIKYNQHESSTRYMQVATKYYRVSISVYVAKARTYLF